MARLTRPRPAPSRPDGDDPRSPAADPADRPEPADTPAAGEDADLAGRPEPVDTPAAGEDADLADEARPADTPAAREDGEPEERAADDDDADDNAAGEAGSADGGEGTGGDGRAPARPGPPWRDRRLVAAGVLAVVSLSLAAVLALTGRSGGGDGGGDGSTPATASTSMETGGLDVPTPEGWSAAPIPQFGFGFAYPPGWEVVVLQPEMLNSLTRSEPQVTGFVEAAHAAARQEFLLYAAGEDGEGRVTDLKVGATPEPGVTDVEGLEDHARQLASQPGVTDPEIERVDGADHPTVRMRFRSTSQSEDGERIATSGVETLVLGPRGILWTVIVTGEDQATVDDIAPRLVDTFVFAER